MTPARSPRPAVAAPCRLWLCGLLLLIAVPAFADEGQRIDAIVAATVRAQYERLHRCYRKQLARDRDKGGSLVLRLTLGPGDALSGAAVVEDRLHHAEVSACVLGQVRGWTLRGAAAAGADEGTQILVPLSFQPAPEQFVVRREDVAPVPLPGGSARSLLNEKNAGAGLATLSLLEVRAAMALPARPGMDQALYVLDGSGRLAAARRHFALRTGTAVWLSPTVKGSVDGNLRVLQLLVPAGLEGGHGAEPGGAVRVVQASDVRPRPALGGRLSITSLLDARALSHRRFYLGLVKAQAGTRFPEHQHPAQAEILYLLAGEAQARCGGVTQPVGPDQALYLPAARPHSATVTSALWAVQVFAPGGPEDRHLGKRGGSR